MARDVGLKVEGLAQVVRALDQFGLDVDDLKDAFSAIARTGAGVMARHVPHRTGRLASNVRGNRAKSKAVVAIGGASVPYAGPIQWGWPKRNIAAAGFFEATDREMNPVAIQMLEQEINRKIAQRGLK